MRNEVTVSACQHLPSVALAKQSFPYVLAGSVIARSLTDCVDQKHGMALFKTAMPRIFINSQLTIHWQKRGMHGWRVQFARQAEVFMW